MFDELKDGFTTLGLLKSINHHLIKLVAAETRQANLLEMLVKVVRIATQTSLEDLENMDSVTEGEVLMQTNEDMAKLEAQELSRALELGRPLRVDEMPIDPFDADI